ncbi:MAG: phosphoenolpyruvate carboxykinase, partial [Acetobacteraceae bacterium]|nr:phosphoenolpyruvate carboxykinase [Acetobacteraceae bacterium]
MLVSPLRPIANHAAAKALEKTGLQPLAPVHANLTAALLVTHALRRGEGTLSEDGALVVKTGVHTGRSVQDKFTVDEPEVADEVWWRMGNQKLAPKNFDVLRGRILAYLQGRELFTQDLYAGADPKHRVRVRLVSTEAWHTLFARNMFIRPPASELPGFQPDWVILHAPNFQADPGIDGVRSSTAIAASFTQRVICIAGSEYGGEIKKSIFGVMNWILPAQGVLPMHCSANIGRKDGDVALFFGLSGTGKTTLSSDPNRPLIGDDEHGWSEDGVFNFEGGCYAKVINLSQAAEPEIYAATHRFGTVLENVVADEWGRLDLADGSLTENTRSCYPIEFIPNCELSGRGGHPKNVVMLTADAFGVLPPISKLSEAQAMYHFLSGYTAKVAGTEKGMGSEPQATFSTCFGAPFIPRRPEVYGHMLAELVRKHGADCWLVNTGWTGGAYGTGQRMSIQHTRALLNAVLDGSLKDARYEQDPFFGLMFPQDVPGIPNEVLNPRLSWEDKAGYDLAARDLVARFEKNFHNFHGVVTDEVKAAAIRVAA